MPSESYPHHGTMPLSDVGREQAAGAARALSNAHIARIVASPLRRALETAEFVGRALDTTVEVESRLAERVFPPLYGLSYTEVAERFGPLLSEALQNGNSDALSLPGVEDLAACRKRVVECAADVLRTGQNPTLIVFHGGPHEWLLANLLHLDRLPQRRWFTLGKCRLSALDFDRDTLHLHRVLGINMSVGDYTGLDRPIA